MGVIAHVCCGISVRLTYNGSTMKPSKPYICVASGMTIGISSGSGIFDMLHPHLPGAGISIHVLVELVSEEPQPVIDEQVHSAFPAGTLPHAARTAPAKTLPTNVINIMQIINLCIRLLLTSLLLQSELSDLRFHVLKCC